MNILVTGFSHAPWRRTLGHAVEIDSGLDGLEIVALEQALAKASDSSVLFIADSADVAVGALLNEYRLLPDLLEYCIDRHIFECKQVDRLKSQCRRFTLLSLSDCGDPASDLIHMLSELGVQVVANRAMDASYQGRDIEDSRLRIASSMAQLLYESVKELRDARSLLIDDSVSSDAQDRFSVLGGLNLFRRSHRTEVERGGIDGESAKSLVVSMLEFLKAQQTENTGYKTSLGSATEALHLRNNVCSRLQHQNTELIAQVLGLQQKLQLALNENERIGTMDLASAEELEVLKVKLESSLLAERDGRRKISELERSIEQQEKESELAALHLSEIEENLNDYYAKFQALNKISSQPSSGLAGVKRGFSAETVAISLVSQDERSFRIVCSDVVFLNTSFSEVQLHVVPRGDGVSIELLPVAKASGAHPIIESRLQLDLSMHTITFPALSGNPPGATGFLFLDCVLSATLGFVRNNPSGLVVTEGGVLPSRLGGELSNCLSLLERDMLYLRYDTLVLKEQLFFDDHELLCFSLKNLIWRDIFFHDFEFKFEVTQLSHSSSPIAGFSRYAHLSFREVESGVAPFDAWPPSQADSLGAFLTVTIDLHQMKMLIPPDTKLSFRDTAFLKALIMSLGGMINDVASQLHVSRRPATDWLTSLKLVQRAVNPEHFKRGARA